MELTAYTSLPLPNPSGLSSTLSDISELSNMGNLDAAAVIEALIPTAKRNIFGNMNSTKESEFISCFSRNAME